MDDRSYRADHARLAGRRDLLLHFVISAGIQIVADSGVSLAIGEFKELLDADGGSGFSFVDLAADRAGTALAAAATDARTAGALQSLLAEATEADFFPAVGDLPENLNEAAFVDAFGGVDHANYIAMVEEIDRRIADRPVFAAKL